MARRALECPPLPCLGSANPGMRLGGRTADAGALDGLSAYPRPAAAVASRHRCACTLQNAGNYRGIRS
jgi:hypothetical protein